jgi:hypothetical protein
MTNVSGPGGGGPNLDALLGEKQSVSTATGQGQATAQVATTSVSSAKVVDAVSAQLQAGNLTSTGTLGAPPPLPNVSGASNHEGAGWRVGWMGDTGDGALMWAALNEMAKTSMRDMKSAKESKRAFQNGAIDSKKNKLTATEEKQGAERDEAARQFVDSVIVAVIVCAISAYGGSMGSGAAEGSKAATTSAAIISTSNVLGNVYKAYGDMASKKDGPQRKADDKELEATRWEMNAEMMEQMVEESQSSYEESKELFKLALRILTEHYELSSQATQTFTRG